MLQERSMTNLFMNYQFTFRNALFLQQQPKAGSQWTWLSPCGQMASHHSAGTQSSAKSRAHTSSKALEEVNPHEPVLQGICYHWSALPVLKECMRQDAVPDPQALVVHTKPFQNLEHWQRHSCSCGGQLALLHYWHRTRINKTCWTWTEFFLLGFSLSWSPQCPGIPIWTIFPLVS